LTTRLPPRSPLFPYTTLFRSLMIEFIAQNLAPIMFLGLVVFLILGYPAAFALAANGLLFFVIGTELAPFSGGEISLSWPLLYALDRKSTRLNSSHVKISYAVF